MQKDRSFASICLFVILLHGCFLLLGYHLQSPPKPQKTKPVARLSVQTISLSSAPEAMAVSTPSVPSIVEESPIVSTPNVLVEEPPPPPAEKKAKSVSKPSKPLKKPVKTVQKELKKPPIKRESSKQTKKNEPEINFTKSKTCIQSHPKKICKENEPDPIAMQRQQKLLDKVQENIAKITQKSDKVSPSQGKSALPNGPRVISALKIEGIGDSFGQLSDQETNYRQELASRLKLLLRLPEYGEVTLKLTLERTGKMVKLVVLNAESKANRGYIEKTLPSLKFPVFGSFTNDAEYTFSISLSNE